jgi:DNA-binding MarR family transcriptional regulator
MSTTASSPREAAILEIMEAGRRLAHLLRFDPGSSLMSANLTMPQLRLLIELARRGGAGGHDLSTALGIGLATITGIADRLVAQGLVSRREDPHDRRVRLLELTKSGQDLIDSVISAGASQQRRILDRLEEDGLAVVQHAFALMLEAAERAE